MDPNTTSLYAFVLGSTGTGSDKTWTAIAIYFGSILSYPCEYLHTHGRTHACTHACARAHTHTHQCNAEVAHSCSY